MAAAVSIADCIVSTPGVLGGKPRIADSRISVMQIAIWHLRENRSAEEIAADFDLKLSDVHAALAFFYMNRLSLEKHLAEEKALVAEIKKQFPSESDHFRRG